LLRACRPIHRHRRLRRQARKSKPSSTEAKPMTDDLKTKKALILETAREIKVNNGRLRRSTSAARPRGTWRSRQGWGQIHRGRAEGRGTKSPHQPAEEAEEQYEEEFEDLLHFRRCKMRVSIMRLDELMRKFRAQASTRP